MTQPHQSVPVIAAGTGPLVVFLHGAPDHRQEWQAVIRLLRSDFRCLAPDLPGFGQADAPPPSYDFSIDAQVAFFDGWLQQIAGDEQIILVMHDIGAIMGMAWAALHPERVRAMLVMNTVIHADYRWHPLARIWSTPVLGQLFMFSLNRWAYRLAFSRDFPQVKREYIDTMYDGMTRVARQSILRHFRTMTHPDFFKGWESRLKQVTQQIQTTVLWGQQDPLIPESYAHRMGGTLKLMDDCGHWVPLEKPERVAEEVRLLY
jgi:pimeloyl-ACP methyl ester carboxylesterase